jgi:DHA3 family macrolide efflux protein-like MFS transporter
MTGFALTIWAWQATGEATALALVGLFTFAPTIIMSPIAGSLVDRWNRKLVMMLSDVASGFSTVIVLILMASGRLEVWHLYVTGAFSGVFQAFQFPAFSAAITMMLDKEQYARANGMMSLANSASNIIAPVTAGILLNVVGTTGIMAFDVATFLVAIGALILIHIPQPMGLEQEAKPSLWKDSFYGFRYIYERPSLLGLQLVFFSINLILGLSFPLLPPMILSRTGDNTLVLGGVQSAFGVGGVVGGALMSAWGGPRKKIHGVLIGMTLSSLLGTLTMGVGQGPLVWTFAAFTNMCLLPFINGSNQAIWQAKVPPEVQGRVFATRRLIAQITYPVGLAIAGPLADSMLGPAMMPGGTLAPVFGWLVGTGPGAGISLIFVITGLAGAVVGLSGYIFSSVRNVEDIIPDHDSPQTTA